MNAIVIDFDGTIADSFDGVLEFLLKQVGKTPADLTAEQRQELRGLSMKALALRVGISNWKLPLIYFRGRAAMNKRMGRTPVCAGMEAVLASLHNEQYRLFIVSSNSKRNINRFLSEHGLGGYFVRVYGSAGWFGKGPVLKKLLQQQKLEASSTVYVGDETRDIIGAQVADMPSVAVSWGFGSEEQLLAHKPTVLVRTAAELQKVLAGWGSNH